MHKNGFDGLQEGLKNLQISQVNQQGGRSGSKMKIAKPPIMDSYYAVNAPAPGTVGVASARINKSYVESHQGDKGFHRPTVPVSYSQYYANSQVHQVNSPVSANSRYVDDNSLLTHSPNHRGDRALYANVSHMSPTPHYASYGYDEEFPPVPPQEDVGHCPRGPPSPVSSSYSELRHTHPSQLGPCYAPQQPLSPQGTILHGANLPTYAPLSHTSSTYESIYEPLTPRPSSQMSQVSSGYHGPYASPLAKGLAPVPSNQPLINPDKVGKEAEVDALTNLLVQSMDSSGDPEFFVEGICARCGEKVIGEGSGCTAMDQVFHIQCFSCIVCLLKLQGKPFYARESKPYCEDCYLNTLEKCCVCTKPILDRILRATGKPYHPQCFTCVVCQKSLDGIPFTVDASNQIHCIDDFHKKFAPRCSVCGDPIMPERGQDETIRVVALDRSFHVNCYRCEDCGLILSSEAEGKGCYPLDNHVLCKSCNARRVQALTYKVTTEL